MVKFSVDEARQIMDNQQNIRNMSVIAHVDHGKSTLTDALLCKAGFISEEKAGNARWTDGHEKEVQKGITIKSTGVSMCYTYDDGTNKPEEDRKYLINLIDSPGHVDFSSEVTAALRVTDGALVVVDTVQGVCVQTETVLRQAMQERIKPVLIINKVDRAIIQLKQDGEEIYQNFRKVIDMVNVVISTYQNEVMGDLICDPVIGNVAFGAGKDQWAFTLRDFARFYSKKLKISEDVMMKKLWGQNYFDKEVGKWKTEPISESGKPLKRAFVQYIMDPICDIVREVLEGKEEIYEPKLSKLEIKLSQEERKKTDKALLKIIMSKWIPAANCLVEMMILHLPSPIQAQKYRTSYLYEGQEEQVRESMERCDPKGPLMIYISKMIPIEDGRFAAFGRIFSGTVRAGEKVKIIGPNYRDGSKEDYYEKSISRTLLMIGNKAEFIPNVPCGNSVALTGIDDYLLKTGTISSTETMKNNVIRPMKYSVSPVFRVAVKASNPMDLPKLIEGLRKLSKSDPLVIWTTEETGENVIAGCGELHMEICIHELRKFANRDIIVSDPIISYRETVTAKKQEPELVKSANKKNRFYGTVEPLDAKLVEMIENGFITPKDDPKVRAKALINEFEWEKDDANRIWTFGPENTGPNLIVDQIKGVQYVNEIKDSVCSAFQWASKQGILAEENMRGIRFNITDAMIHADPAHRKQGQIVPSSRRLFHGLELMASPTLEEPIFMCEITSTNDVIGGIYQTISQRRGTIIEESPVEGSPLSIVKAYLPVSESYGFTSILRGNTQGKAFPQCFFDHWEKIPGMPLEDAKGTNLVMSIRKRKGLKEEIPEIKDLLDKL